MVKMIEKKLDGSFDLRQELKLNDGVADGYDEKYVELVQFPKKSSANHIPPTNIAIAAVVVLKQSSGTHEVALKLFNDQGFLDTVYLNDKFKDSDNENMLGVNNGALLYCIDDNKESCTFFFLRQTTSSIFPGTTNRLTSRFTLSAQ